MVNDVLPISGSPGPIPPKKAARLCNFVTSSDKLNINHQKWLGQMVNDTIRNLQRAWIVIEGFASKRGDAQYNFQLSLRRCKSVENFINLLVQQVDSSLSRKIEYFTDDPKGESESLGDESNNDGYWRAVAVYVYGTKPLLPKPTPPPLTTSFEIRLVGGGSASIIGQADNFFFQIVDLVRLRTAFYLYTGGGIGISIPKIPGPGSISKAGPPTAFSTARSAELYQFNSKASLFQDAGTTFGNLSAGGTLRLSITEITDFQGLISTRPGIIPIEGGSGFQMPGLGSVTQGVLSKVSDDFLFSGY